MRSKRKYRAWYLWGAFVLILAGILYVSLKNQPKYIPDPDYTPERPMQAADFETLLNQNMDLLKNRTPSNEELSQIYLFIQEARRNPSGYMRSRELRLMLDLLEKMHAEHAVADQVEQLRIAEEAGNQAMETGNYAEAVRQLTRAVEIQTDLNNRYYVSPPQDHSRLGRMEASIQQARVQPLLNKSSVLEAQGDAALEAEDWQVAIPLYKEAYELQQQVNQSFRGSRFSNHYRSRQLQDRLRLVEAGLLYQEAQKWIHAAEESAVAGNTAAATNMYREAERELLRLIERYPANPFVNRTQLGDILRNRENLEAFPLMRKVLTGVEDIRSHLQKGEISVVLERLPSVYEEVEAFFSEYPESNLIATDIRYQAQYLMNVRSSLADLNSIATRYIRENTEEVNGVNWALQPVTQTIYQRIMPRRSRGSGQNQSGAVTQVTYSDAAEFCRRLSAISGYGIRLPSTEEYAALRESESHSGILTSLAEDWSEWSWEGDSSKWVFLNPFSISARLPAMRDTQTGFRFLIQSDEEK